MNLQAQEKQLVIVHVSWQTGWGSELPGTGFPIRLSAPSHHTAGPSLPSWAGLFLPKLKKDLHSGSTAPFQPSTWAPSNPMSSLTKGAHGCRCPKVLALCISLRMCFKESLKSHHLRGRLSGKISDFDKEQLKSFFFFPSFFVDGRSLSNVSGMLQIIPCRQHILQSD